MQSPPLGEKIATHDAVVKTNHYDGFDISPESVQEARRRFESFPNKTCTATFTVADCFAEEFLVGTLPSQPNFGRYSVVSIQFAIHYACKTTKQIDDLLLAVRNSLVSGGILIATTVDPHELSRRVRSDSLNSSLFQISLDQPPEWSTEDGTLLKTGTSYHFRLQGFVDCTEYVVPLSYITQQIGSLGFREYTPMSASFNHFLEQYKKDRKKNKGLVLTSEEEELSTLYRTMCFVKE
ncbi:mRNA (guanine-N7-)-methyltransferase [Angomonas deanei]|nr:mRNA (guanine-N7-)-methyltransferase [Angomonas deanei]|eukprot:EPY42349.1 mRNA (guanine-N7-)-methyltransferase [Angomonas deanei]